MKKIKKVKKIPLEIISKNNFLYKIQEAFSNL